MRKVASMCPHEPRIRICADGPYIVSGGVPLAEQIIVCDDGGESVEWREGARYPDKEAYSLCRCGKSAHKPFCDGTHASIGFDGTETASREPYAERAERCEGPGAALTDAKDLCSEARFCAARGKLWRLVDRTGDPDVATQVIGQAGMCPSGRYVACDAATGEPIEPFFEPSIGLIEDPDIGVSGGVWVRGGIPVESSDGYVYEVRNRMTLCRCGESANKPFCDGSHCAAGFNDHQ